MRETLIQWQRFVARLDPSDVLRPVILESWRRSRLAGVDPAPTRVQLRRESEGDTARRIAENAELIAVARPHLEWLSSALCAVSHVGYLVDVDGIVLYSTGTDDEGMRTLGLLPGYDWSEAAMGTNGAGTALASGEPVSVVGEEHYAAAFHGAWCTGAPIVGPTGEVVGAIDISTAVETDGPERLMTVAHAAYAIGQELAYRHSLRESHGALEEEQRLRSERDRLLADARAAREVAEAALQARDTMLARVTHDLRTPIAANYGYATLMRDGIPEPLPAAHQANVHRMIASQEIMLGLLDELLKFARGASATSPSPGEVLDVDTLLGGIEPVVAPQLRAADLAYTCVPCATDLAVHADRLKALEILLNLVSNAIKFTPAGGRVTVAASPVDGCVRITVSDTGDGIPESTLGRIFDPFVGGTEPRSRNGSQGFGLGLAISRELARGMGGALDVASTVGSGSTFTLTLPRARTSQGR